MVKPAVGDRRDFFVSYTAVDREWAEWIAWQLEDAEYTVLLQAWDMVPGSNWLHMMNQATRFCERTVVVLSAAYLADSTFGEAEWLAAYRRDPSGLARRVIPIRVDDCTVDGLLAGIVYADLVGTSARTTARSVLLEAVRAAIASRIKPLAEPPFPGATAEPPDAVGVALEAERDGIGPDVAGAAGGPVARSRYVAQVRQIAPQQLTGREPELAAITAFCMDAAAGSYVWWRAAAWTGKTALMASWVLDSPPGVRVVSFFVTARFAGSSDRAAYLEAVVDQLATLSGQSVPPFLSDTGQERLYWSLLEQAAESCRRAGQRLILLVDGLDEDRGVTGPQARSIAGMLPANPPAGMRVVVAGRTDPPVPADVPAEHPLRDPAIVWVLRRSEHAAATKAGMQADLARLRNGSRVEQDVLGLVTAAGGGLSTRDLAELCQLAGNEVPERAIEQMLATVAGRSFASRDSRWSPGDRRVVYVLGHEEIQQEAVRSYGPVPLAGYRELLHGWAQSYRDRGWPAETPEYLLRGYYRLLLEIGDLRRAVGCATDLARHDRMLDLSGGDTAALAEITDVQNAILATARPDLSSMARVAYHRGLITERNSHIPETLPAVWVLLGHPDRAEQLANAITDLTRRAWALGGVACALARVGERDRAEAVAGDAEAVARNITDATFQARALSSVSEALAQAGKRDRAEAVARDAERIARTVTRTVDDPSIQAPALSSVAEALAQAGERDRAQAIARDAERIARTVSHPSNQALALSSAAKALAQAGERDRGQAVACDAERIARTIASPSEQAYALGYAAEALAQVGERNRAREAARDAERLAGAIADPKVQGFPLSSVAGALAQAGDYADAERVAGTITERFAKVRALSSVLEALAKAGEYADAERVARTITDPSDQARALSSIAGALARAGERDRAQAAAADAERVARSIIDSSAQADALSTLAEALAHTGEFADAERIARSITSVSVQAGALSSLVEALAQAGERDRARAVARDAERIARNHTDPNWQAWSLNYVAEALGRAGEYADAERVARTITYPAAQAQTWSSLADALAQAGELADAERVARTITDPSNQVQALSSLAKALTRSTDRDRAQAIAHDAERVARSITDSSDQVRALSSLAKALAQASDRDRARAIAHDAERLARTITNTYALGRACSSLAEALAQAGEHTDAERVARIITRPLEQGYALSSVTEALAQAGEHADAERIARTITDPDAQADAMSRLAATLAQAGEHDRARRWVAIALSIGDWRYMPLSDLSRIAAEVPRSLTDCLPQSLLASPDRR